MSEIALAKINSFAHVAQQADVSPVDPILEIPVSEFKGLLNELAITYNMVAEMVKDSAILRGRDLARMTTEASNSIKSTGSPVERLFLINAHTRRILAKVRDALKTRPSQESGKAIQVCSKIMARAIQIIDYLKTYGQDGPTERKGVSLDSQQARLLFAGKSQPGVSRRDTIRAMKRAEALWPALQCAHRPNDGRQTMRLTISREDLGCGPEMGYSDLWQRSERIVALSL